MGEVQFTSGDRVRFHTGNLLGRFFPDRESRILMRIPPDIPLMYHAVGHYGNEGAHSTLEDILVHIGQLAGPTSKGYARLVSFDDGYASSIPSIRSLCAAGIPVVWFVTTWFRHGAYLPKDLLRIVAERLPRGGRLSVAGFSIRLLNDNPLFRRWIAFRINRSLMVQCSHYEYQSVLARLYADYRSLIEDAPDDLLLLASADALRSLVREFPGLRIGAHGSLHYRWDRLQGTAEIRAEIIEPRRYLEELLDTPIDEVAYPYGFMPDKAGLEVIRSQYRLGYMAEPTPSVDPFASPRFGMDGVQLQQGGGG